LKAQNEHDKSTKLANENFAKQFATMPKDTWTLVQLLKRIHSSDQNSWQPVLKTETLYRMANKVRWGLEHGWTVSEPHDLGLLGELTQDEQRMSEDKFYANLETTRASKPVSLSVKGREVKAEPIKAPKIRLCANKYCRKGESKTKGIVPKGSKGGFCSKECRWASQPVQKAPVTVPKQSSLPEACAEPA
jgi:hypothetical protein